MLRRVRPRSYVSSHVKNVENLGGDGKPRDYEEFVWPRLACVRECGGRWEHAAFVCTERVVFSRGLCPCESGVGAAALPSQSMTRDVLGSQVDGWHVGTASLPLRRLSGTLSVHDE